MTRIRSGILLHLAQLRLAQANHDHDKLVDARDAMNVAILTRTTFDLDFGVFDQAIATLELAADNLTHAVEYASPEAVGEYCDVELAARSTGFSWGQMCGQNDCRKFRAWLIRRYVEQRAARTAVREAA